jgi:uncharacterized protein (DUF983 family)
MNETNPAVAVCRAGCYNGWMPRWLAILRLRCPRCRRGRVFEGLFRMRRECPECGLLLLREPGYYLGAMYFSYALGILLALPLCLALFLLDVPAVWNGLAAAAQLVILSPLLFRYSRVLWLHLDQRIDPR